MKASVSEQHLSKTAPAEFRLKASRKPNSPTRLIAKIIKRPQLNEGHPLLQRSGMPQPRTVNGSIFRPAGLESRVENWEGIGGLLKVFSSKFRLNQHQSQVFEPNHAPIASMPAKKFVGLDSSGTKAVLLEYKTVTDVITGRPKLRPSSSLVRIKNDTPEMSSRVTRALQSRGNIITWQPEPARHKHVSHASIKAKPTFNKTPETEALRVSRGISIDVITGRVLSR